MIEQFQNVLLEYGIGGIFIAYLIYRDTNRMQRIMERLESLEKSMIELFKEQREQDRDQQNKLFQIITKGNNGN